MTTQTIRTIIIVPAEHAAALSVVAAQMEYPQDFTLARKVCALSAEATVDTPATHYLINDEQMPKLTADRFRDMSIKAYMPQVDWAETTITNEQAVAAAQSIQTISEGNTTGDIGLMLEARGLMLVPEPSIDI